MPSFFFIILPQRDPCFDKGTLRQFVQLEKRVYDTQRNQRDYGLDQGMDNIGLVESSLATVLGTANTLINWHSRAYSTSCKVVGVLNRIHKHGWAQVRAGAGCEPVPGGGQGAETSLDRGRVE